MCLMYLVTIILKLQATLNHDMSAAHNLCLYKSILYRHNLQAEQTDEIQLSAGAFDIAQPLLAWFNIVHSAW